MNDGPRQVKKPSYASTNSPLRVLTLELVLLCVRLEPSAVPAPLWRTPPRRSQQVSSDRYQRRLTEEVPYIITQEERTLFEKLTTDADRDKFIHDFWERRNPEPGSPRNAFKQQYYSRLAYAKLHYHYLAKELKDDRARIYILYGPPDKVEQPAPQPGKLTGDYNWVGFKYPTCLGPNDHASVQQNWSVTVNGNNYNLSTTMSISVGRFNGTYEANNTITIP